MTVQLEPMPTIVFAIVIICWCVFAGILIFRKKPAPSKDKKKNRTSIIGFSLQGLSYAIVWSIHRPAFTSMFPNWAWLDMSVNLVAVIAAVGSVALISSALRTLGKEWSITARTVEDHELATKGAYAYVRHPVYTGMLGMLIATAVAIGHWAALPIAIVVFAIGTLIRIRIEERLLRETFGARFDSYAKRVPAVIPGIF